MRSQVVFKSIANVVPGTIVLGPNPRRVGVILSPSTTQSYSFKFDRYNTIATEGVTVPANSNQIFLSVEVIGETIKGELWAMGFGATVICLIEVIE